MRLVYLGEKEKYEHNKYEKRQDWNFISEYDCKLETYVSGFTEGCQIECGVWARGLNDVDTWIKSSKLSARINAEYECKCIFKLNV